MRSTTFERAVAEWQLGRRPVEDMPAAATAALLDGLDSPSLAQLAGMEGASWSEIESVLFRVVAETGGLPAEREAMLLVVDGWLERLANGQEPHPSLDYGLAEILGTLGGEYEWFRRAIFDFEVLDAVDVPERYASAVRDVRERARAALVTPHEELLARPEPVEKRPFLKFE